MDAPGKLQPISRRLEAAEWRPTEHQGINYSVLRLNEQGGGTVFLKFDADTHGKAHTHPAGEELLVLSGSITIGGTKLGPGDYLYTPPDGVHDAIAHETTVMLLSAPKPPVFL